MEVVEEDSPGAIQGGLTEVVGVSCKLLLFDGVDADSDKSLFMGRVSSYGSTPGLVGKISADPISLQKVASESTDSLCIIASVSSWVSETQKPDSSCLKLELLPTPLTPN